MQHRKQKLQSNKRISRQNSAVTLTHEDFRTIMIDEFSLKEIQTLNVFVPLQLAALQMTTIEIDKLRDLTVDTLKLTFIFDPLKEMLMMEHRHLPTHIGLKAILRILFKGEFYRFIHNHQNQIKILTNNRTTDLNVKILIASLFVLASRKLTLQDISTALLFFSLEAALSDNDSGTLPMESQKIYKVLKKIERVIKPLQFKTWMESVKNTKDFAGCIEPHHFIYLCSLSQKKFINGLSYVILQPKVLSLFKNFNMNSKIPELQFKTQQKEIPDERRVVRGLTLLSPRKKKESFSKQILKQFRMKNPSKNKRPDTAHLRRHVRSFGNLNEVISNKTDKQNMQQIAARVKSRLMSRQVSEHKITQSKLIKKKYEKKPDIRLKLSK